MSKYHRKYEGEPTYVRKLDSNGFDNIISGINTRSELNIFLQKKYDTFYNISRDKEIIGCDVPDNKENITWLSSCWENLRDWIKDNYTDASTLRINLEALSNILLAIDKNKFREDTRIFFIIGKQLQNEKDNIRDDSLFTERELDNLICYDDIVNEQQRWFKAWCIDRKNKKLNIYHLILAFNTMIPPIRRNYHELVFHRDKSPPPKDNKINYLYENNPGEWTLIINYDKVENKRESKNMPRSEFVLSDEIPGVTKGKQLNKIINESLLTFPRDTLLTCIKTNHPMSSISYDQVLQFIFKPKRPTQTLIRKAYVNHWYRKPLSTKILNVIAFRMRHSVPVARASYYKINYSCDDKRNDDFKGAVLQPQKPVAKPVPKKDYFDPSAYSKKYRQDNKDKIKVQRKVNYDKNKNAILKSKILWSLNTAQTVKHPSKKSIEKYNIQYSPVEKKWI